MNINFDLPDDEYEKLTVAAHRHGMGIEAFVLSLVTEAIADDEEQQAFENAPREQAATAAGIQRGLDDFAAGRFVSLDEVITNLEKHHNIKIRD